MCEEEEVKREDAMVGGELWMRGIMEGGVGAWAGEVASSGV